MLRALFIVLVSFSFLRLLSPPKVNAVEAGDSYLRFSRMRESVDPGDVLVVFTTSATTATEATFRITLDSEWVATTNFSSTAGDYTTTTTGIPGGTTAATITGNVASSVSSNTIIFTLTTALNNSTAYAFIIQGTGFILNPAASTTIQHTLFTADGSSVTLDSKSVSSPTVSNDQITVSATVAPSFTLVLGANTAALGTLSSSAVTSATGVTATITTNAQGGWTMWGLDANQGLTSAVASYTIATSGSVDGAPSTLSTGSDGYVLDADLTTDAGGGGTVTVAAEYNGATTSAGGTLSSSFQPLASADGTANGDVITMILRATIAGSTPAAADYADTLTIVGAGTF